MDCSRRRGPCDDLTIVPKGFSQKIHLFVLACTGLAPIVAEGMMIEAMDTARQLQTENVELDSLPEAMCSTTKFPIPDRTYSGLPSSMLLEGLNVLQPRCFRT